MSARKVHVNIGQHLPNSAVCGMFGPSQMVGRQEALRRSHDHKLSKGLCKNCLREMNL